MIMKIIIGESLITLSPSLAPKKQANGISHLAPAVPSLPQITLHHPFNNGALVKMMTQLEALSHGLDSARGVALRFTSCVITAE